MNMDGDLKAMRGICWAGRVVKFLTIVMLVAGLLGCMQKNSPEQLDNQLVQAVINRDQGLVRTYLQQGANPNATNVLGIPVIFSALSGDNATCDHEILSALLEHGADVNVAYGSIDTLMNALVTDDIWCVRALVNYGAKVNAHSVYTSIAPGSVDILRYLLEKGFDPCIRHEITGETMLDMRKRIGDKTFVDILEKFECGINSKKLRS